MALRRNFTEASTLRGAPVYVCLDASTQVNESGTLTRLLDTGDWVDVGAKWAEAAQICIKFAFPNAELEARACNKHAFNPAQVFSTRPNRAIGITEMEAFKFE